MRLRPYKRCDADRIASWIANPEVFRRWGGERFGTFPIDAETIHRKYTTQNGDCPEPDNFYPWTAVEDDGSIVGHFIMRYTGGDPRQLRFGWVIVDHTLRGAGYGTRMLALGLRYAFDILGADIVTIGVFENNPAGHRCYQKVGFTDTGVVPGEPWNVIEMAIRKQDHANGGCI